MPAGALQAPRCYRMFPPGQDMGQARGAAIGAMRENLRLPGRLPGGMDVLRLADYRNLWLMGTLSSVARWLDQLAYALFAYQHTGSAFVVAMLTMFMKP